MRKILTAVLAATIFAISLSAHATTITLTATGEGWCSDVSGCNNTNINSIQNTFAGNNAGSPGAPSFETYRNWFNFVLPTTSVVSATIRIWNDSSNFNTVNPGAYFHLYEASAISFAGLTSGPSLGSVHVDTANAGPSAYVDIALNAAGISALNAAGGSNFLFGGNNDFGEQIFGYTGGVPIAQLVMQVPAPAGVLILAVALVGFTVRKKHC